MDDIAMEEDIHEANQGLFTHQLKQMDISPTFKDLDQDNENAIGRRMNTE